LLVAHIDFLPSVVTKKKSFEINDRPNIFTIQMPFTASTNSSRALKERQTDRRKALLLTTFSLNFILQNNK